MDLLDAMRDLGVSDPAADTTGESHVRAALAREIDAATATAVHKPRRARRTRVRPGFLAGSTVGLAGVAAAVVLAVGGTATPPAFAVTHQADGSVLVQVNVSESTQPWVQGADQKLASMGIDEQIMVSTAPGPATSSDPVACTALDGPNTPAGPPVQVLLGSDGTQVIPAGNTGAGTVHLASCAYFKTVTQPGLGNTGNTGAG